MKKYIHLVIFLFIVNFCKAQNWVWAQRLGNIKSDKVTCIKTDDSGYVYIAGYFTNQLSIGTNNVILNFWDNSYSKEIYVAKLDSNGYCYWARSGGEHYDDRILGMDVDSAGNVIVTGTFWEYPGGMNFNGTVVTGTAYGNCDQCFVYKLDRNGNVLWGTFVCGDKVTPSGGNYNDDQGLDVATDKFGNSYIVGFMTTHTLFCGGNVVTAINPNTSQHHHCYWLAKINSNGVFEWAKTFGNLPWDGVSKYIERDIAVCVDERDGVYVTGGFDSTRFFGNTTLTTNGGYDCFVMKYDSSGNFKWVTKAGSTKDDWSNGICSDHQGHIYITGEHRDSLFMDTVIVKNYDKRDVFVIKIDDITGKPLWGKRAGSNKGSERGNDVWADEKCNVYVCGDINEGAKFGDNIIVPSGADVQGFVAKITPEGKWVWVATGGGLDSNDRCNAIDKGKGRQLYTGGYFRSPASYGTSNLTSSGSSDGFFARLNDSSYSKTSELNLQAPIQTNLCYGDTIQLSIPTNDFLTITPTTGFVTNSDTSLIIFSPLTTTTYTLIGYTFGGCADVDTVSFTINVSSPFTPFQNLTDSIICAGESLLYTVPNYDNINIFPTTAGISINTDSTQITFFPTISTTYWLVGTKGGICPRQDTLQATIGVYAKPTADFEISPSVILIQDPIFDLRNKSTNGYTYKWYENNVLFSTSTNVQKKVDSAGIYCFTLITESIKGCIDSITRCGEVIKDERVFFTNAFSPNNDNLNDDFKPILLNVDLQTLKQFSFKIANRYGELVYESSNPYFGWDGNKKGVKCDVGTYYYFCKFVTATGKVIDVKGDVSLIR